MAAPDQIDALARDGLILPETSVDLARSGIGVAVRKGATLPDVSSIDAFKRTLLNADADIVSELVARGDVEIGMVVVTQIQTTPGVMLVGPLPEAIQNYVVFSAGISSRSQATGAAKALLSYLAGPEVRAVMRAQGMQPMSGARR